MRWSLIYFPDRHKLRGLSLVFLTTVNPSLEFAGCFACPGRQANDSLVRLFEKLVPRHLGIAVESNR